MRGKRKHSNIKISSLYISNLWLKPIFYSLSLFPQDAAHAKRRRSATSQRPPMSKSPRKRRRLPLSRRGTSPLLTRPPLPAARSGLIAARGRGSPPLGPSGVPQEEEEGESAGGGRRGREPILARTRTRTRRRPAPPSPTTSPRPPPPQSWTRTWTTSSRTPAAPLYLRKEAQPTISARGEVRLRLHLRLPLPFPSLSPQQSARLGMPWHLKKVLLLCGKTG